ncbi:Stealth CR1 domain-containing protein [Pararhizobium mangrovi]|uniref:Stealth CR1 domain-containing protein n=1 Tax=Pararhizobium mangrovi TaxID=2590452 RepID=UPI0015E840E1|nr:Stealth CR1 domain-containing protein [Pararhizobium mangrovi]
MDIDFVIPWVDGADPAHAAERRRWSREAHSSAVEETRFHDDGEIYYAIASILAYAPFVRRIHLVTDAQKPAYLDAFQEAGLCAPDFIRLVSHHTIFDGLDALRPTFNPRPIESAVWRIPGLSDQFVYANDDMFLNAPSSPQAFFRSSRPVLYGTMSKLRSKQPRARLRAMLARPDKRPGHRRSQERAAELLGLSEAYLFAEHHPHPLDRRRLERFHAEHPQVLSEQVRYRFRDAAQYNSVALSNNLEVIAGGTVVEPPPPLAYLRPGMRRGIDAFLAAIGEPSVPFGCVQSLDRFSSTMRREIHEALSAKFAATLPASIISFLLQDTR